jgi:hypothetical protein
MKRINMLRFPVLLCQGLYILIAIAATCVTVIFVHIQIDPQYYAGWNAGLVSPNGMISRTVFESWNTDPAKTGTLLSFDQIKKGSLYFNYFQIICTLSLILFTVKEFLNVIDSVKLLETFQQRNVQSFQKMYKYLFVIFILSSIRIVNAQEANLFSYSLQFTPLILSVAALIMAEIFKQGNQLLEENQLTI